MQRWISIHALTRSATIPASSLIRHPVISIHALTRSATCYPRDCTGPGKDFNPRTHEECDANVFDGASLQRYHFNPRTHEECDAISDLCTRQSLYFNPRTHEECDMQGVVVDYRMSEFQSTHPRGVPLHPSQPPSSPVHISIHALTRSATSRCSFVFPHIQFQSTHSRGVRQTSAQTIFASG